MNLFREHILGWKKDLAADEDMFANGRVVLLDQLQVKGNLHRLLPAQQYSARYPTALISHANDDGHTVYTLAIGSLIHIPLNATMSLRPTLPVFVEQEKEWQNVAAETLASATSTDASGVPPPSVSDEPRDPQVKEGGTLRRNSSFSFLRSLSRSRSSTPNANPNNNNTSSRNISRTASPAPTSRSSSGSFSFSFSNAFPLSGNNSENQSNAVHADTASEGTTTVSASIPSFVISLTTKDGRSVSLFAEEMAVWQRWHAALREAVADLLFARVFQLQSAPSPTVATATAAAASTTTSTGSESNMPSISSPTSSKRTGELSMKRLEIGLRRGPLLLPPAHCHILRVQRLRNIKMDLTDVVQRLAENKQALSREDIITLVKRAECDRLLILDASYVQLQHWLNDPLSGILNKAELQLNISKEEINLSDVNRQDVCPNMVDTSTTGFTLNLNSPVALTQRSALQSPVHSKLQPHNIFTANKDSSSGKKKQKRNIRTRECQLSSPTDETVSQNEIQSIGKTNSQDVPSEEAMFLVSISSPRTTERLMRRHSTTSSGSRTSSGSSKSSRRSAGWSHRNSASPASTSCPTSSEKSICLPEEENASRDEETVVADMVEEKIDEQSDKTIAKNLELLWSDESQSPVSQPIDPKIADILLIDNKSSSLDVVEEEATRPELDSDAASLVHCVDTGDNAAPCDETIASESNLPCTQGVIESLESIKAVATVEFLEDVGIAVVNEHVSDPQDDESNVWKPRPSVTPAKLPVPKQMQMKPTAQVPGSVPSSTATTVAMLDPSIHKVYQRCLRQLHTQHLQVGAESRGSKGLSPVTSSAMRSVVDVDTIVDDNGLSSSATLVSNNIEMSIHQVTTPSTSLAQCENLCATQSSSFDISAFTLPSPEVLCGSLNESPIDRQLEQPKTAFDQSTQVTPTLQKDVHKLREKENTEADIALCSEFKEAEEVEENITMTRGVKERKAASRRYEESNEICDEATVMTFPEVEQDASAVCLLTPNDHENAQSQQTSPPRTEDRSQLVEDSLFFHISPSSTTVTLSAVPASSARMDPVADSLQSDTSQRNDTMDAMALLATVSLSMLISPSSAPLISQQDLESPPAHAQSNEDTESLMLLTVSPLTPDTVQSESQPIGTIEVPAEVAPEVCTSIQDEGTSTDDLPGYFQSKKMTFAPPELDQIDEVLELLDELSHSAGVSLSQYPHHLYSYPPPPSVIYQTSGTHSCGASTVSMLSQSQHSIHSERYSHQYQPQYQQLASSASVSSSVFLSEEQSEILCPPYYQQQHYVGHLSYPVSAAHSVSEKSTVDHHGSIMCQNSSGMLHYSQSMMNVSHASADQYLIAQSTMPNSLSQYPSVSSPEHPSYFISCTISPSAAVNQAHANIHQNQLAIPASHQSTPSPPQMPWELYRSPSINHHSSSMMPGISRDASNELNHEVDDDALDVSEIFDRLTFPSANSTNEQYHIADSAVRMKKSNVLSPYKPTVSPLRSVSSTAPSAQACSPKRVASKSTEEVLKAESRSASKSTGEVLKAESRSASKSTGEVLKAESRSANAEEEEDTGENNGDRSNINSSDSDINGKLLQHRAEKATNIKCKKPATTVTTSTGSRRERLMQKMKSHSETLTELVPKPMEKPIEIISVPSTPKSDSDNMSKLSASSHSLSGCSTPRSAMILHQELNSTKARVNELSGRLQRMRSKLLDEEFVEVAESKVPVYNAKTVSAMNETLDTSSVPIAEMKEALTPKIAVDSMMVRKANKMGPRNEKQFPFRMLTLALVTAIVIIVSASIAMRKEGASSLSRTKQQKVLSGRYTGLQKLFVFEFSYKTVASDKDSSNMLVSCTAFNTDTNTSFLVKEYQLGRKLSPNLPDIALILPSVPVSVKEQVPGALQSSSPPSDALVRQMMDKNKSQLVRSSRRWLHRPVQFLKSVGKEVKDRMWKLFRGVVSAVTLMPPEHQKLLFE